MQLTQEVIQERNITALMVTHNLEYAIRFGTRLIMLHEGQILLDIKGEHKKNLTIAELVDLFKNAQGGVLTDEMVFS
jgi:putative ABC transport system ATP-binding protein